MKSFRVNADYEQQLFFNGPGPAALNQTLEFLFFFLEKGFLFTQKKYSEKYLSYVARVTENLPQVTSHGNYENWWGPLKNVEREKWWNSKLTTTEFQIQKGWCSKTHIILCAQDILLLDENTDYLIKDPFGMSGQKFQILKAGMDVEDRKKILFTYLERGIFIVEPWLHRVFDFSHYIFPDGRRIVYQNLVDEKFQYKGTNFSKYKSASLRDLSFYEKVNQNNWAHFKDQLEQIIQFFSCHPNEVGYSIDSFVYEEEGELKVRAMTEVNYRRTMGRVAFELAQKYGLKRPWAQLELFKAQNGKIPVWEKLRELELNTEDSYGLLVLSPGDSRFEMIFFSAASEKEGEELLKKTKALLSKGKASINL